MKLSSVRFLCAQGAKNVKNNLMMSIASVGMLILCLLITGASMLLSKNISQILGTIESRNSVSIYLSDNIEDEASAKEIGDKIAAVPNVEAVSLITKEEAAEKFKPKLGELYDELKNHNIFPYSFRITLSDISGYDKTITEIQQIEGVDSAVDRHELFDKLSKFDNIVSLFGVFVVVILGLVSMFILSNTIRLTMYSRRFEISIMKSVGATDWFVRLPFLVEGVIIGLTAALISAGLLRLLYDVAIDYINRSIPFLHVPFSSVSGTIFMWFLLAGIGFGVGGGLISISKYLKKEGGEILGW